MTDDVVRFDGVPETVEAGDVLLRRWRRDDVAAEVEAINASLEELRPWMPWAAEPATEESVAAFIATTIESWEQGTGFDFSIRDRATEQLIGGCGLMARRGPGVLEIGYWVRTDHTGRGVATAAAGALTALAGEIHGCERVEIHCDEANTRSAAVPRRLGFTLSRTEHRDPTAPGETEQDQVWVKDMRAG